jgi:hypothetical protein
MSSVKSKTKKIFDITCYECSICKGLVIRGKVTEHKAACKILKRSGVGLKRSMIGVINENDSDKYPSNTRSEGRDQ